MRYLILAILVLLSACNLISPAPPAPPTASPANTRPSPTLPKPASPAITVPVGVTPAPIATGGSPSQDATFASDLLPEFQADATTVQSPTIYRLDLSFSNSLDSMSATQSVTYTNRTGQPLNEIYFRLFANYPDGGDKIAVNDVQVNGAAAETNLEAQDTALKVAMPQPLAPGSSTRLDLKWNLTIPISHTEHYADFTNSDGIVTLPSIYPLIPAYDDKGWHTELAPPYGDLVYSDVSLYDVRITAPVTATVIASGSAVEHTTQENSATWHYVGAPMRDFSINLSSILEHSSTQVGEITVNSYYLPADAASGKDVLKWAADAVRIYQDRIGAYPFKELDVVETPTTAGGIEYPGLVVLAENLYHEPKQRDFLEFADAHEVAHQWWYSMVGDDQVNTPWMDESFVQYTTFIYEEQAHGTQTADFVKQNVFQRPYDEAKRQGHDLPIGLPVASYTEDEYGAIVYGKGPLFFDVVRQRMGDEKYFQFIKTYYARYRYKLVHPDDMLKTMNEVGGQDFTALFNQWVYGK